MANTQEEWVLFHTKSFMRGKHPKSNLWWVSNHGRIKMTYGHNDKERSINTFLTGGHRGSRYLAISTNDAPEKYVHKLVAWAFLPPPAQNEFTIDHLDMNKLNNHVDNLRWATHADNINAAIEFKKDMTPDELEQLYADREVSHQMHLQRTNNITQIRLVKELQAVELRRSGLTLEEIGETLNTHHSTIYLWLKKHLTRDEMISLNKVKS
tara:strand:- start:12 stop:641 length:630 start_codon:yes stop_codon:yes gene_type:complete